MIAGILNERIKVIRPTISINEYGEKHKDYEVIIETRANVDKRSGNREIQNDEIVYTIQKIFKVRSYHKIENEDIIEWDSKQYRIITIDHDRQRNMKTLITELINE